MPQSWVKCIQADWMVWQIRQTVVAILRIIQAWVTANSRQILSCKRGVIRDADRGIPSWLPCCPTHCVAVSPTMAWSCCTSQAASTVGAGNIARSGQSPVYNVWMPHVTNGKITAPSWLATSGTSVWMLLSCSEVNTSSQASHNTNAQLGNWCMSPTNTVSLHSVASCA